MPPSTSPVSPTPPPQPLRMQVLTAVPHFPGTLVGRRRKAALPRAAPASASGQPSTFSFPSPPPPPSPPTAPVSPCPPRIGNRLGVERGHEGEAEEEREQ